MKTGHIYIARADHHLLVDTGGRLLTSRGPKENRFRPAIDPLFRSVAAVFGRRAIGVVLTGYLDDGTAGLWAIREHGGVTVVQNPEEAMAPSMPMSAIKNVEVNHIVHLADIGRLLTSLVSTPAESHSGTVLNRKTALELRIAREDNALEAGITDWGSPSHFACPECHGVLLHLTEGGNVRFRCHTGHAYSLQTLLADVDEKTEDALWVAIRCIDESIMLMEKVAEQVAGNGRSQGAAELRQRSHAAQLRGEKLRQALTTVAPAGNAPSTI